jgi:hypothetical protein
MVAPLRQQIRCFTQGHDWRLAIDPEGGYYQRCRRCWRAAEASPELIAHRKPPVKPRIAQSR